MTCLRLVVCASPFSTSMMVLGKFPVIARDSPSANERLILKQR